MRAGDWMMSHAWKNGSFGLLVPTREAGVLGARHNSTPSLELSKSVSLRALAPPVGLFFWVLTESLFNSHGL